MAAPRPLRGVHVVVLLLVVAAGAADPAEGGIVITKLEDIYPVLPPAGAKSWDPTPLLEGIKASTFEFTPKHVYELVDRQVRPDVVQVVAAKAALFYDPAQMLPLQVQAANARVGAKQTVNLDERNFAELFTFFRGVHDDLAAAEKRVGPAQPKQANESQSMYERRLRSRDESLVRAKGPFEARIDGTTFAVALPAVVVDKDGCKRSVATYDASAVDFDDFRLAMGTTKQSSVAIALTASPTIEKAGFSVEGTRRFEAVGRCGTTATRVRLNLTRAHDGAWSGNGQF